MSYSYLTNSNTTSNPNYIPPATKIEDKTVEKRVARDILNMIERVCFSEEYRDFRVGWGSNGQRDFDYPDDTG